MRIVYLIFDPSPSAVVRARMFKQEYRLSGWRVEFIDLFSPFLLKLISNTGESHSLRVISPVLTFCHRWFIRLKKFIALRSMRRCDVVVLLKYISDEFVSMVRKSTSARLVYDFDDSVWLPQFMGAEEFGKVVSKVDTVTCDNEFLASKARQFCAATYVVHGPVPAMEGQKSDSSELTTIGWLGSSSTAFYLYSIYDVLEQIGRSFPNVQLHVVGSDELNKAGPRFEKIKTIYTPAYDSSNMISILAGFDIGLYPLFENDLSLGRGALKAVLYMSAKVPVVATRLGENMHVIADGTTGFLASTKKEWLEKISLLVQDVLLRHKMGESGFEFVKHQYSIPACFLQFRRAVLDRVRPEVPKGTGRNGG